MRLDVFVDNLLKYVVERSFLTEAKAMQIEDNFSHATKSTLQELPEENGDENIVDQRIIIIDPEAVEIDNELSDMTEISLQDIPEMKIDDCIIQGTIFTLFL